jgi:hypothetical protein
MVDNKRGQEMTLGTIIAIVLGIAVLVLLIWGFTSGWSNLWEQISGRTSGSNVELRIADCQNDCDKKEQSAWCNEKKDLRYFGTDGKTVKVSGSCKEFSMTPRALDMGFKDCSFVCSNATYEAIAEMSA